MPIYEYQCSACGHKLEVLQRISEDPLTDCPDCGDPALRKLVSASGFILKGSGWYVTDFKDKPKPDAGKTAGDGKDAGAKEAGKSSGKDGGDGAKPAPAGKDAATPASAGSGSGKESTAKAPAGKKD